MDNKKIRVVLVDDNQNYCSSLSFLFDCMNNIEFTVYNDAKNFLNEYSAEWSGILMLDLFMPDLDGIGLLEELRLRNNKMYTIVVSGHADNATSSKVKMLGADDFMTKPFDVNELIEKIQRLRTTV